jgi:hypothetical protein
MVEVDAAPPAPAPAPAPLPAPVGLVLSTAAATGNIATRSLRAARSFCFDAIVATFSSMASRKSGSFGASTCC